MNEIAPWYRKPTKKGGSNLDFYFSIPRDKFTFGEIDENTYYKIEVKPIGKKKPKS